MIECVYILTGYISKLFFLSLSLCTLSYSIFCIFVIITLNIFDINVVLIISAHTVFSILIMFIVFKRESLIQLGISGREMTAVFILLLATLYVFISSNFLYDDSWSSEVWKELGCSSTIYTLMRALPKFEREAIYIPMVTGKELPESEYCTELIIFVIQLWIISSLIITLVEQRRQM